MDISNQSFSPSELDLFRELTKAKVEFLVVGMSAAVMQGVPAMTDDIDLWFRSYSDRDVAEAVRRAGGFLGSFASTIFGKGFEDIDIVIRCSGLRSFEKEYEGAIEVPVEGEDFSLKLLPLKRVIASKTAADREKDRVALPILRTALLSREASRKIR